MQKGLPVKGIVYDPLKERVDRFALAQALFEDFSFSAKLVETVIQLLASPEEALVIKALHHLDQFAMKYIKHYEVLYQKQILAALYGHLGEGHLFRRRFAWKLLSQMFVVPEANLELMENEEVFKGAAQTFAEVGFYTMYYQFYLCHYFSLTITFSWNTPESFSINWSATLRCIWIV